MRLRELPRVWKDDRPHLGFVLAGGQVAGTFCGLRADLVVTGSKFEDVCPRCISNAKHVGYRE